MRRTEEILKTWWGSYPSIHLLIPSSHYAKKGALDSCIDKILCLSYLRIFQLHVLPLKKSNIFLTDSWTWRRGRRWRRRRHYSTKKNERRLNECTSRTGALRFQLRNDPLSTFLSILFPLLMQRSVARRWWRWRSQSQTRPENALQQNPEFRIWVVRMEKMFYYSWDIFVIQMKWVWKVNFFSSLLWLIGPWSSQTSHGIFQSVQLHR